MESINAIVIVYKGRKPGESEMAQLFGVLHSNGIVPLKNVNTVHINHLDETDINKALVNVLKIQTRETTPLFVPRSPEEINEAIAYICKKFEVELSLTNIEQFKDALVEAMNGDSIHSANVRNCVEILATSEFKTPLMYRRKFTTAAHAAIIQIYNASL